MNYEKIYYQIINRAKNRVLNGYKEKHHIIPKCIGGTNNIDNIVELTAREHFIAHQLLTKIHPDRIGLYFAVWLMCNKKSKGQLRNYKISSRLYEHIKKICANNVSLRMRGRMVGLETRLKLKISHENMSELQKAHIKEIAHQTHINKNVSVLTRQKQSAAKIGKTPWNKGIKYSDELKSILSKAHLGYKHTPETKQKISEKHIGKYVSEETKQKIKEKRHKQIFSEETRKKMSESAKNRKKV